MNRYLLAICFLLLFSLESCYTTYQVEPSQSSANAQSRLILYRKNLIAGAIYGLKIYANGNFIGELGPNRYISCWLPAGTYLIELRDMYGYKTFFKIKMETGETYAYAFRYTYRKFVQKMDNINVLKKRRPPIVSYYE